MKTTRKPGRTVRVRLVRQGPEEDAFDDAFWESVGPTARVESLWGMLLDHYAFRGIEAAHEPGIQRSVIRIRHL